MKEVNCNIIRDILPLYADDVVSEDTAELVEEHLHACCPCRQYLDRITATAVLPMEVDAEPFKQIRRTWGRKQILLVILSALLTITAFCGIRYCLFYHGTQVTSDQIQVSKRYAYDDRYYLNQCLELKFTLNTEGKALRYFHKMDFDEDENGNMTNIRYTLWLYEVFPSDKAYSKYYTSYTAHLWYDNKLPLDQHNGTLTVIYKDKTETYTIAEEGLLTPQETGGHFVPEESTES